MHVSHSGTLPRRLGRAATPARGPRFPWTATTSVLARSLTVALLASAPALAAPADAAREVDIDHDLSMEFVTPHTKWATPYANGKVRVLFLTSWTQNTTYTREVVELMQRFDLQAEAVYYYKDQQLLVGDGRPERFGDEHAGTARAVRLLQQPLDVLFFHHLPLRLLPDEVQSAVRQAVASGVGFVGVGETDSALVSGAAPLEARPAGMRSGSYYALPEGRGVLLPAREQVPYGAGWETAFDYQMEQHGRALLWAARRSPTFEIDPRVTDGGLAREALPAEAVSVTWGTPPSGTRLRVELRRADGAKVPLGALPSRPPATLGLPRVRAGDYHVDVFAESDRGVEGWATLPFAVTTSRGVEAVALDRGWGETGDNLAGAVHLTGPLQDRDRLRVQLLDSHGRVLVRQDLMPDMDPPPRFSFSVEPWMPMLLRVEALLLDDDGEVAVASAFFQVTRRHRGQSHFLVWGHPYTDLAPYALQAMAREGVSLLITWGGNLEPMLAAHGLSVVPYATRICPSHHSVTAGLDSTGVTKGGCFHDAARMDEYIRSVVERHAGARGHGVFAYSLGDENTVRASCLSSHCLLAYRDYLREEYGGVEALNASWGTGYPSFDAVDLLPPQDLPAAGAAAWFREYYAERRLRDTTDDHVTDLRQAALGDVNDEVAALQAGNFARWYDRQSFQLRSYVDLCRRFVQAFKQLDPEARTGFEGAGTFEPQRLTTRTRMGGDLDLFVRELEYWGPYPGATIEVVRSLAPPGFPSGNWLGYSQDADVLLRKYWDQVTNNLNVVQWWRWDNLDQYHGFLTPTLSVFAEVREMLDDTRIVRQGLGNLLMQSAMHDDGVAMLFSLPSSHMAHFDGNPGYGHYERDHLKWHRMVHDAGLQFRYVTDRMLRQGEFDPARYKVLILPLAFCLGPEEARVIADFVRGGGTVIADVRPGIYDGHGKPLVASPLDEVFGIRRSSRRESLEVEYVSLDAQLGGRPVTADWRSGWEVGSHPPLKVDPAVEVSTAKALGKAFPYRLSWPEFHLPVCTVNGYGRGRAVLLNFGVYDAPAGELVRQLLAEAGATPALAATWVGARADASARWGTEEVEGLGGAQQTDTGGVEVTRWQNGDIELVALYAARDGEVQVTLPQARLAYDLKAGQTLGAVAGFTTRLRRNRAAFFALLPRPAAPPAIAPAAQTVPRGTVAYLALTVPGAAGRHAVNLRVTTPEGTPADWFDRSLVVDAESQQVQLPFAFNDPEGVWRVEAVDLYTGQAGTAQLDLR